MVELSHHSCEGGGRGGREGRREGGREEEREGGREGGNREGREESVYSVIHPHSLELSCVGNWSQYLGLSSNKLDNRELFKPGTAPQVANISPNPTFS